MSKKFALATVLRFRETVEERELRSLERIQQQDFLIREEIDRTNIEHEHRLRKLKSGLDAGMSGLDLLCAREQVEILARTRNQLERLLAENKRQRSEQSRRYQQSRCDRETVSEIRDRAELQFRKEQERREQSALDDLFGARRRHGK